MKIEEYTKRLDAFLSQFPNFLDTPEGQAGIKALREKIIKKYFNIK